MDDISKRVRARLIYQNFRQGQGPFFSDVHTVNAARKEGIHNFWSVAESYLGSVGPELFIKLLNGYADQGESERLNKQVKNISSTDRNRQCHEVTEAYLTV